MISVSAGAGRGLSYLFGMLLIGLGAALGVWQAARHYRPLLDDAKGDLTRCGAARGNLETLSAEQGLKLGAQVLAGNERQARAEQAVKDAEAGCPG